MLCGTQLLPETLYLTTNLIDRFLELKGVSRKNLQLVRMASQCRTPGPRHATLYAGSLWALRTAIWPQLYSVGIPLSSCKLRQLLALA